MLTVILPFTTTLFSNGSDSIVKYIKASTVSSCFYSDIDECMFTDDLCAMNATCTNTEGSYNCSCDTGFGGNGTTCCECVVLPLKLISIQHMSSPKGGEGAFNYTVTK